ncbi:MAG: competence protein ComEC, partial [Actinomycetota bacterium]|nr:competence protein ComEC [Actinomycetota bacterium]
RLLLTGDIEPPAQAALVRSGADLGADVLKVPHHGSARQDADFLVAVDPALAVICVGADNGYGHPAAALVDTLHDGGADVARTDLDGDVAVLSDGSDPGAEVEWAARGPDAGAD